MRATPSWTSWPRTGRCLQPSTVHSDTHGQSAAIFGLAFLLGIELMPRIRSWQDLHLFRA